jgi:NitT/TauT family transport system substrate-binding protein
MKIRIGHLSTFYHTAILLQAKAEADARLGAEVEWKLMGTGPAIMQAFSRGELDLAYVGLPPAIIGIDQGIHVVCIAGGHMEGTVMAGRTHSKAYPESGISDVLKQFSGQKIGVPGKGSIHDVILRDMLAQHGLTDAVSVVNFPWADLVLEAIVKNEVAAAVGTPALAAAIRYYAAGKVLIPASQLWPDNPSYGIVVHQDFLKAHREMVEEFLKLHEEATEIMRTRPQEAAALIAAYVGIVDEKLVLDAISISPRYCAQLTEEYIASTMRFVPVLKKLGYIKTEIESSRIFQRDLINKVHPEKDHYLPLAPS